jgi:hypothetical protein
MIEPTAISVTGELPEIAAKPMQAMTAEMPSPPGSQPTSARVNSTSRRAMPPSVMSAPAPTNIGMAMNASLSASEVKGSTVHTIASQPP